MLCVRVCEFVSFCVDLRAVAGVGVAEGKGLIMGCMIIDASAFYMCTEYRFQGKIT
jgi:hypothetical protein